MKYQRLFLILILTAAFFLRIFKITAVPPSLNWDEVSIGYNAYSILKTGRDEWGVKYPLHFKSFGEYKLPAQIYASIPAIYLLGLTPFSVRITPAIYGTLTVLLLFYLVLEIFFTVDRKIRTGIALVSSLLLAVSPWHIQLTRGSFESSFALMWVILGVWFLVKGFKKPAWWIASVIPFILAMYTYNSARLFVPIFIITIGLVYIKRIKKYLKVIFLSGLLFITLLIPTINFFASGEGTARYKLVSITDDLGLIPRIEERRNASTFPKYITNIIHNRYTYVVYYIGKNYLAHFTPNYLFIKGAFHKQHHPQGIGELYLVQLPFLLFGLYKLFKKKKEFRWILIIWLLTAIVPASITNDIIPHALRTLNASPVYQILTGYGMIYAFVVIRKKYSKWFPFLVVSLSLVLFLFQFIKYQVDYYQSYPSLYSRDWQYGNKKAVEFIKQNYDKYDLIVYTREYGEPHVFTLFYLAYPPDKYQNDPALIRFETYDWVRVLKFDKFYFPDLGDAGTRISDIISSNPGKKILFIATPDEVPENSKVIDEIKFLNGKTAFKIIEN